MSFTFPKEIEDMWHAVYFCFPKRYTTPRETQFHQSLRLDIGKVQFALTDIRKEKSIAVLKKKGVEFLKNDKNMIQVEIVKRVEQKHKLLEYLETVFEEHILDDYASIPIDLASTEGNKLLCQLSEDLPLPLQFREVAIYYCKTTKTLFVVGEMSKVHKMLKEHGLQKALKLDDRPPKPPERERYTFRSSLSAKESFLLGYLGFKEHIKNSFPDTEAHVTQNPPLCVIERKNGRIINGKEEIRRFLSTVKKQKLAITDDLCDNLLFDKYPSPNESFYLFIKNILPKSLRQKYFYINKSETGEYIVNCLDEGNAKEIATLVEKNIVSTMAKVSSGYDGWRCLDKWSKERKVVFKKLSADFVQLCCTFDIHKELQDRLVGQDAFKSVRLSLPGHILTFLKLFGNDLILDIKSQFDVLATIGESELQLKGRMENLQKSEDHFKSELGALRKSIPVGISVECIENKQDEIDKAMAQTMCVWDLQNVKRGDKLSMNCEYLASWIDPIRQLSVTVVNGSPWHMKLDLQVVMTNQCLFPVELENLSPTVPEDFLSVGKKILEVKQKKKMNVGEYTRLLPKVKGAEATCIVALVIDSDNGDTRSRNFDMKQGVVQILQTGVKRKVTNFGVNASMGHDADTNVRHTIEAAIEYANAQPGQIEEVFICCQMEQDEVLQNVNEMFRKKRGFLKNIYSCNAKRFESEGSSVQVEVNEGYLHEMEADVIVNTTNAFLKLNEGGVSSKISEMAGPSLHNECQSGYPNGLSRGQVAVTHAHNLKKFNRIYHISLPQFNVETFREDVKMYVKKCLCQAERDNCRRIAFPALGVGQLQYPRRETAVAMFDAVEEYGSEVVNPVLKSVKFAVNVKDSLTNEAFLAEEWRRSKRCVKEIGLTKPFIKPDFRALVFKVGPQSPSIRITTLADFGIPPAYAIEVFFGYDKIRRKGAFDGPPSWNDRWFLKKVESQSDVTESLREFLRELTKQEDRVTEIIIYTNDDFRFKIPEEQQVESICSVFLKMKPTFLQEIIVVVSDETCLQRTSKLLQKDKQMIGRWNEADNRSSGLKIEVIGKSKSCADNGEKIIEDLLLEIDKEIATTAVSRLSMIPEEQTSGQHFYDSKGNSEVEDEVTAELNHGIISFKKTTNDWDAWVTNVEKTFRLKVNVLPDKVTVGGKFDCILNFESYLDKIFPDTPPSPDTGLLMSASTKPADEKKYANIFVEMTELEYKGLYHVDRFMELINGETVNKVQYSSHAHGLSITCLEEAKDSVHSQLEELRKQRKDPPNYRVLAMTIRLKTGDITEIEEAECIAVPSQGNLARIFPSSRDIVGQLARSGGHSFLSACSQSYNDNGFLDPCGCRIVHIPTLPFTQIVALVNIPYFKKTKDEVSKFMETFVNMLKKVDEAQVQTLTLPFLGSDIEKGGLSLEECAEHYVLALCRFQDESKKERKLTEIVFVDRNKESVEKIQSVFNKHIVDWINIQQKTKKIDMHETDSNPEFDHPLQLRLPTDQPFSGTNNFGGYQSSFTHNSNIPGTPSVDLSANGMYIPYTKVKLFVAKGRSWEVSVNAIICFIDEKFEYLGDETGNILQLAPESYKKKRSIFKQYIQPDGDVIDIDCRGGSLSCYNILHVVVTKHIQRRRTRIPVDDIMEKVVKRCNTAKARSLAVSLDEGKDQSSKSELCSRFLRGILRACQTVTHELTEVHLMSLDDECLKCLQDEIRSYIGN